MRPGPAARTMTPMRTTNDVSVLVVGAGPAGLATAIELARHDIPTLLVERRTSLSSHPRATVRARVELGTELTGLIAGPDGARLDLRDVRTGARRMVQARYVVAADGA